MDKQNINIGDKLLCKNSYYNYTEVFYKDREYEIVNTNNYYSNFYSLKEKNNKKLLYLRKVDFYDVFYTKQEERKIKLNKLKNDEKEY